ncbi:MAG TPA: LysM domain-containing protein [Chloroflexota bacterium]|nr:LysM domain-containing protein [Chloroflexota bacterium]
MAFLQTLRRRPAPQRAGGTWPAGTWAAAAATRPAEAVPAPRRRAAPRDLPAAAPGSLAASVLAAGLEDVDLGLERLDARPGRSWPVWPLGLLLGIALIIAAGVLWQQVPTSPASQPTASAPTGAAPAQPPVASPPDPESRRAALAPPPAPEPVPGPGGLAVSIRPVESNYTVVAGDTLERIAQRFGTTVDALVGMNNLGDRNTLRVGQQLIIP